MAVEFHRIEGSTLSKQQVSNHARVMITNVAHHFTLYAGRKWLAIGIPESKSEFRDTLLAT